VGIAGGVDFVRQEGLAIGVDAGLVVVHPFETVLLAVAHNLGKHECESIVIGIDAMAGLSVVGVVAIVAVAGALLLIRPLMGVDFHSCKAIMWQTQLLEC
jgi:hypothetical protein